MKKLYIAPKTSSYVLHQTSSLMIESPFQISDTEVSDGFTKEDNGGWSDIWDE